MQRSYPISTELNIQIILATVVLLYTGLSPSYATPQVKLIPSDVAYFSNEGSLTLICTVDQDVSITSVIFRRDALNYVGIFNPTLSQCTATKYLSADTSVYSTNCDKERNFTLIKNGSNAENHRKNWMCVINSLAGGPCVGANNPCLSKIVTAILQVPVTAAQLMNALGQTLTSSVNIVRGESTGIRCSTAPRGSRPRALFRWYYRQGNQSPILIVDQSVSPIPDTITVPGQESDVLISYSTWTLTGNVSYHNIYIFCEAQDETNIGSYTQSDEVQVSIVYLPVVQLSTHHSTYNVTEGMQNFLFTCNIIEANPLPQANSYSWFHKTSVIPGQTSSSITLPSVLKSDAGEYKCTARNDYGIGTSNSLDLIVQYPPNIIVMLTGSTQQNQTAVLVCGAWGVPAETTFYPWVHMWEGVPIRTGLKGKTNSTHSVLTLDRLSLESMGTYVCTASNGIFGISGKLNQTGLESLHVKGAAYILGDNARFVGEIGFSASMSISYYSDPAIESFVFQTNGRNVMNTSRTMTHLSKDIVNYKFHNKTIQLDAQKAHFMILNVTAEDFDNYTLVLMNSIGITTFPFDLDAFGPPLMVQRFYFNRFIDDQIELHFDAGFNGGPEQTFVIEFMSETSVDNVWKTTSVAEIREKENQYILPNGTFFVKVNIPSPGSYIYRIYSWNVKGRSPFSDNITVTIQGGQNTYESIGIPVAGIAGGVSAGFVVILIVNIGIFLWRRNQHPKKTEQAITLENNRNTNIRPTDSDLYEKLHSSASNDIQMYSSLTIQNPSEDHQKYYENT